MYAGHEVAVHTVTHPSLTDVSANIAAYEIINDRAKLEELTGELVRGFAYPYGTYNKEAEAVLRACGIEHARTVWSRHTFDLPEDFLEWHPTCHHRDMLELAPGFLNLRYNLGIFYVWGHSYEFGRDGNWDDMERFADMVAGKDDGWDVTNIELARYIKAFRALVTSADGHRVYNPTAVTVWIASPDGAIPVTPGAMVEI